MISKQTPTHRNFAERAQRRWLQATIGPPPLVRRFAVEPLRRALLPLVRPNRRLRRLDGENPAGPLSLAFLGRFKRSLLLPRKHFFSTSALVETDCQVPFWKVDVPVPGPQTDLTLIDGGKTVIRSLPLASAIAMPARVDLKLELAGGWEGVKSRFRKRALRRLKRVEKRAYSFRISTDRVDFERFHYQMYSPTVRSRHGSLNLEISPIETETYFRHGFLFVLTHDGEDVAAGLCHPVDGTLHLICYGIFPNRLRPSEDIVGALQVLRIRWAIAEGYAVLNFKSAPPSIASGLFQYKRQWGSRVVPANGPESHMWLGVREMTPAVGWALRNNPLIVANKRGGLDALVVIDDPAEIDAAERDKLSKSLFTPGLTHLLLSPAASWSAGSSPLQEAVAIPFQQGPA